MNTYVDINTVAAHLGEKVTVRMVRGMMRAGKIPYYAPTHKTRLFVLSEVDTAMKCYRVCAGHEERN